MVSNLVTAIESFGIASHDALGQEPTVTVDRFGGVHCRLVHVGAGQLPSVAIACLGAFAL